MPKILLLRMHVASPILFLIFGTVCLSALSQQPIAAAPTTADANQASGIPSGSTVQSSQKSGAPSKRSKRRRHYVAGQSTIPPTQTTTTKSAQVAPTAEQRARDQKILEQQKAQSARIARENDATTKQVIRDRQRVQAEQRIQSAPGPNDQPLPGAAVVPPSQPTEQPRIQDAPGPAQTLPTPATATSTAPQ